MTTTEEYQALVRIGGSEELHTIVGDVYAESPDEARLAIEAEYGVGTIVMLWSETRTQAPRQTGSSQSK